MMGRWGDGAMGYWGNGVLECCGLPAPHHPTTPLPHHPTIVLTRTSRRTDSPTPSRGRRRGCRGRAG
ncbi:MAG: hypothetical protein FJ279_21865 [Planctomycetes bacterium]|nr:hypothetical protein [Planctomycetota bacterium]